MLQKSTGADNSEDAGGSMNLLKIFLAGFSTAYNVVLYAIFNTNFRQGFKAFLCYGFRKCSNAKQVRPTMFVTTLEKSVFLQPTNGKSNRAFVSRDA
jgi:hypothetical protein